MPSEVKLLPKDEEEIELEGLVFGDLQGFESNLKKTDNLYDSSSDHRSDSGEDESDEEENLAELDDDKLFFVDEGQDKKDSDVDMESGSEESVYSSDSEGSDAWADSDDEKVSISLVSNDKLRKLRKTEHDASISGRAYINRLRSQFNKIYPPPSWVDDVGDESEAGEEEDSAAADVAKDLQGSTNSLLEYLQSNEAVLNDKPSSLLQPIKIDITRLKDANYKHLSKSAIQTMCFHPRLPLLVTSGYDRTLRIYHIDGKTNHMITSLHLRHSPIQTALFAGNNIFAAGRRRYMYKWDVESGELNKISRLYGHESTQKSFEVFRKSPNGEVIGLKGNSGYVNIISTGSGQWIKNFKVNGVLSDFAFTNQTSNKSDDTVLIAVNTQGELWEWEVRSGKLLRQWADNSNIGVTTLALGGMSNRWLAVGTTVGVVSIYDRGSETSVKPMATVENLVSTISSLVFSPDGQVLCIASRAKKDALRLVHLPTGKVFQNWPTSGTPLGRVTSVCFSPGGEFLCCGNQAGKVRMWRLNHY